MLKNILSQKPSLDTFKKFNFVKHNIELPELEATTTSKGRLYRTPDGLYYPSVTTVLSSLSKKSIESWRKKVGNEEADKITKQATDRGTLVHNYCEKYLLGDTTLLEENFNPIAFNNFLEIKKILDKHVDNIHYIEAPLYSNYLKVAGRVDLIAEFDNKLSIIDFKTSRKEKSVNYITNYFLQTSCYAVMYEELTSIPINRCVIIISQDDAGVAVHKVKRDDYISGFIKVRENYELQNKID